MPFLDPPSCRADDGEWKYFFRSVRTSEVAILIQLDEGQEIVFGRGDPNGQVIAKPNPEFCNIKLALARVMDACGAADIIMEMYERERIPIARLLLSDLGDQEERMRVLYDSIGSPLPDHLHGQTGP